MSKGNPLLIMAAVCSPSALHKQLSHSLGGTSDFPNDFAGFPRLNTSPDDDGCNEADEDDGANGGAGTVDAFDNCGNELVDKAETFL